MGVRLQSDLDVGTVVRALGDAMSHLTPEEQDEHLRRLFDHLWNISTEMKADFIARMHKAAKDAAAERERMNLTYGGNVAYRYKAAQGMKDNT